MASLRSITSASCGASLTIWRRRPAGRTATQQKIGDYFSACMNEAEVEKLGAAPLKPALDAIAALKNKKDLAALLGREHLANATDGLLFGFGSDQDFSDSIKSSLSPLPAAWACLIATITPSLKRSQRKSGKNILPMCRRCWSCWVIPPKQPSARLPRIMKIETALAKASLTRVEQRDPHNLFHKMDRKQLQALTPDFDWNTYLKTPGLTR